MTELAGARQCFNEASRIDYCEVEVDCLDEVETLHNVSDIIQAEATGVKDKAARASRMDVNYEEAEREEDDDDDELAGWPSGGFGLSIKLASEDTLVKSTRDEYRRLWKQFKKFCAAPRINYVKNAEDLENLLPDIPANIPEMICTWIMYKADELDIFNPKKHKDPNTPRVTFQTAMKMRAAMSYKFSHDFSLHDRPWQECPTSPGTFIGNPSLSPEVSQYMISLKRRKARAGEQVTSARAIDSTVMKALYTYNLSYPKGDLEPVSRQELEDNPENWGGYHIRVMLQTCYVIAMLCLLRFDEALTTTWDMVHFEKWEGGFRVRLDLVVRKTHQYGGIAPFYLYPNHEKPWMCPCQMLALWWKMTRDLGVDVREKGTFIFRKKIGKDRVSSKAEDGMSSASFLTCFRHNLCDIDIDPAMYGTHSFRRGGCQYLAIELRWPLRHICTWGGWTENFDNPGTIFKYLLSWVDTPMLDRSDYMNPLRAPAAQCSTCGRTCYCA